MDEPDYDRFTYRDRDGLKWYDVARMTEDDYYAIREDDAQWDAGRLLAVLGKLDDEYELVELGDHYSLAHFSAEKARDPGWDRPYDYTTLRAKTWREAFVEAQDYVENQLRLERSDDSPGYGY